MSTIQSSISAVVIALVAGPAVAQTDWLLSPEDPVLDLPVPGAWDDGGRLVTSVVKVEGAYHMYFKGWSASDTRWLWPVAAEIGHATSSDGIAWQLDPANPVLRPGGDDAWDHASLEGAAVIHDGSEFRMWYAAVTPSEPVYPLGYVWHGLGYATSPDGSTWTKHPGNPIVDPWMPSIPEGRSAVPRTVLLEDGLYRMWFSDPVYSWSGFGYSGVGYAESDGGLVWKVRNPDIGATLPSLPRGAYSQLSVVPHGDLYFMFISDVSGYPWTYVAASRDGISWSMWPHTSWLGFEFTALSDDGVLEGWSAAATLEGVGGIYRRTSHCCPTVFTWLMPAAAAGAGAEGSHFSTEVVVTNAGDSSADYRFAWLPRGEGSNRWTWIRSGLYSAPPRSSVRFADVLAEVFGLGPRSFGAVVVEASSDALLAMARISNSTAAGVISQSIPAVRVDEFIAGRSAERRRIVFGSGHERERFNLICQAAELEAEIMVELYDDHGTLLETTSLSLKEWSNGQLNRVFDPYGPVLGYAEVWSESGDFYCFGSLLDNDSSDAITIPPM